jgi:hypothetical protein
MSGVFFFVVVVVVVIFIIRHVVKKTKRRVAEWSLAAQALGLDYVPAGLPIQTGSINGECQGVWISVALHSERSGRNSTTYTRYVAQYPERLPLELRLTRQGFFHDVASFFGVQDIEVGDPDFDALVIIKGDDEQAVRNFLTPERRAEITALYARFERVSIDSGQIVALALGASDQHQELVSAVEALIGASRVVSGAGPAASPIGRAHGQRVRSNRREVFEPPDLPEPSWDSERATDPGVGVAPARPELEEAETEVEPAERSAFEMVASDTEQTPVPVDTAAAFAELDGGDLVHFEEERDEDVRPGPEPLVNTGSSGASDLCETLFGDGASGYEIDQRFAPHAGERVVWSGTLSEAEGFDLDFELGSGAGTRAVFEVHRVTNAFGTAEPIKAVVRLPEGYEPRLESLKGRSIEFAGRLEKVKGLMKELILLDGELIG